MPYSFKLINGNNVRIISKQTLSEALRSRHSYKKSPHFKQAFVGRVYYDPAGMALPELKIGDIMNFKVNRNASKKRY
jgi:hypothetical protein